jgi:hypothetical protein
MMLNSQAESILLAQRQGPKPSNSAKKTTGPKKLAVLVIRMENLPAMVAAYNATATPKTPIVYKTQKKLKPEKGQTTLESGKK